MERSSQRTSVNAGRYNHTLDMKKGANRENVDSFLDRISPWEHKPSPLEPSSNRSRDQEWLERMRDHSRKKSLNRLRSMSPIRNSSTRHEGKQRSRSRSRDRTRYLYRNNSVAKGRTINEQNTRLKNLLRFITGSDFFLPNPK